MKKNMKKLLAFLCAVVLFVTAVFTENAMNQAQAETETSTQATSTEPTPVELYGFENVTLNDFVHYTSGSTMGETDYVYGVDNTYKLKSYNDFNKKLFTAWVKFTNPDTTQWWLNRICIGGTASNGWGLSVALTNNGNSLIVSDADTKIASPKFERTIEGTEVGVDSFLNTEFLLQIGYEYLDTDSDGANDAVRVLVYVNGNEALNEVIENCDMTTLGNYVRFSLDKQACTIGVKSVELPVKPVELDGFTNVSVEHFTYVTGGAMAEKEHTWGVNNTCYLTNGTDFDKKLFTANVKFSYNSGVGAWNTRIHVGGKSQYTGLAVYTNETGTELTVKELNSGSDALATFSKTVSNTTAGVASFLEFLLQMGYEYLDTDADGTNDAVRVLVYANGNNIVDETIQNCNMSVLGNYLGLNCEESSSKIGVSTFKSSVKPVTLSSHDTVTISDFQDSAGKEMEAKGYDYDSVTPTSIFSLKGESTNFNDKLLSMKVKFGHRSGVAPSWENRLVIPAADGSNGIFVFVYSDGTLHIEDKIGNDHFEAIDCATAGVTSFKDTPFILQMSFKDTTSGLELDVYIDGKLVYECAWTEAKTSDYSAKLDLTRSLKDAFIVVSDVDADEFPADPAIMPDSSFERITFGSFGIKDGTYSKDTEDYTYNGSLDKKVLCGKVKFVSNSWFNIRLGGNTSTWDTGLYLAPTSASNMDVQWLTNGTRSTVANFNSEIAGVEFIGETAYDLMISMEVVDVNSDGVKDVKFGVWFDNKLYGDTYYDVKGVGEGFGNKLALGIPTGTVTLNSVKEYLPQPDEKYERVTFQHFLVEDGEYESKGAEWFIHNSFKKKDNLDKIIVCGDVLLNGGNREYMLALGEKGSDPYNGIFMYINGSDMTLNIPGNTSGSAYISSTDAGVGNTFIGNQFSLMWSVEFVDSDTDGQLDDVKVQLWFDGFLCVDYTFEDGGTAEELGNTFAVCSPGEGDSITLNSASELIPQPDESLQKLSLPDFVHNGTTDIMESGTFSSAKSDGWYVSGNAKDHDTLDGKVVSFDILQSGTASTSSYQMRLGGKTTSHWTGLALNTADDGTMDINWSKSDGSWAIGWQDVDMTQAAASNFLNETFNLMVSMELVDADGNGTSDIKVRIWFNKILYVHGGQDSIIFYDIGSELGNTLAILCSDSTNKAFVSLRTVAEYQSNPYYYENISEYRQSTGYKEPDAPEGYVFSGWYEDEDYTTALARETVSGSAYAKFTEDDVLKVKAQVGLNADGTAVPEDETSLRFVTTVDSLEYRKIAFKYAIQKADGTFTGEYDSYASYPDTEEGKKLAKKVYSKLYAIGADSGDSIIYKPNAFSWKSEYFKAWSLTEIQKAQYDTIIRVTAYWTTMDGTNVRGESREVCVNDFDLSAYKNTSSTVTLHFLGQNTMPIAGYGIWNSKDGDDSLLFPNYTSEEYFKMFADAGINLVNYSNTDYTYNPNDVLKQLDYGGKYGVGMFVTDEAVRKATDSSVIAERINSSDYSKKDAFCGMFLVDEPGGTYFKSSSDNGKISDYASQASALTSLWETLNTQLGDGNKYVTYSNMFPVKDASDTSTWDKILYENYVEEFNEDLDPEVLSWDYYPFEENKKTNGEYDMSEYFWNMDLIRSTAVNSGKPFWAYVQAGSQWKGSLTNSQFDTPYYPTESQFKWNVNTSLAFGAQGIQYYPLIQPIQHAYDGESAEYDFEVNGIISAWGGKTPWYYYAQEINKQIAAIDEVLMNAKTEKVVVPTSGDANTDTNGLSSVATSYGKLNSVSGDAMVGYFNYGGKVALYVVNYQMFDTTETATSQNVTLTFTEDYNKIKKIEDATTAKVKTSSKQLTLNMEAGEGILLVLE